MAVKKSPLSELMNFAPRGRMEGRGVHCFLPNDSSYTSFSLLTHQDGRLSSQLACKFFFFLSPPNLKALDSSFCISQFPHTSFSWPIHLHLLQKDHFLLGRCWSGR